MRFQKADHKNRSLLFVGIPLLLVSASATRIPSPQTSPETVSGLQMTIRLNQGVDKQSDIPKFTVEFRNSGETDLILNLGVMLGGRQYPNAVVLTLTDSQSKSRRLDLKEPFYVAGRVDRLLVPLPIGSTFSLPVDLEKYWAAESKEFDYKPQPGAYFLEAQFRGRGVSQQEANLDMKGIALMPYWTGSMASNRLRFEFPNR